MSFTDKLRRIYRPSSTAKKRLIFRDFSKITPRKLKAKCHDDPIKELCDRIERECVSRFSNWQQEFLSVVPYSNKSKIPVYLISDLSFT